MSEEMIPTVPAGATDDNAPDDTPASGPVALNPAVRSLTYNASPGANFLWGGSGGGGGGNHLYNTGTNGGAGLGFPWTFAG